jgi:hypothetical protein
MRSPPVLPSALRISFDVVLGQHARADAVVDVVVDVGDDVGDAHDVAFEREGARLRAAPQQLAFLAFRMFEDAVADFDGEIQSAAVVLEHFDDAHRLPVVIEAALHELVERRFAGVSECGVAEVVAESDGLGENLVEAQRLRDRARDLRDFEHMREPRAVVIALGREKDLRLVLEPAKGLAMNDAIAVALIRRPNVVLGLLAIAPARLRASRRARHERVALDVLEHLADRRQNGFSSDSDCGVKSFAPSAVMNMSSSSRTPNSPRM